MGWDRRGERAYYYRSVRTPDGPRRVYLGSGSDAADAAAAVRRRQEIIQAEARDREARAARHAAAEAPLDALGEAADRLVRALLLATGYHCPNHGPWRKRRDRTNRPDASGPGSGLPAGVAGAHEASRGG